MFGFKGHKDSFSEQLIDEYEKNLVNLINDVRDSKLQTCPLWQRWVLVVQIQDKFLRIHKAQMAVGDKIKYPNYAGNVASVDTRDFWKGLMNPLRAKIIIIIEMLKLIC